MDRWEDYPEDDGADWWHQLDQEARRHEAETGQETTAMLPPRECEICGRDTARGPICGSCAAEHYGEPVPVEKDWQDTAAEDAGVNRWGEI